MANCSPHRQFLAAIADGETDLVPPATLDHVRSCSDCTREIRSHQVLASHLREASELLREPLPAGRSISFPPRRIGVIAASIAGVILVAGTGVGWFVLSHPDPAEAAITASSQPMQIESTNVMQVGQWCLRASGRTLPAIELDGMDVVGARMDRVASTNIVTVTYTAPSGARVAVSWLEGAVPSGSGVEARKMSGRELLIVHAAVGTAVITGSSVDAMWQMAAAIESTAAQKPVSRLSMSLRSNSSSS